MVGHLRLVGIRRRECGQHQQGSEKESHRRSPGSVGGWLSSMKDNVALGNAPRLRSRGDAAFDCDESLYLKFPRSAVLLRDQGVGLGIVEYLLGVGVPADLAADAPGDVHQVAGDAGPVAHLGAGFRLRAAAQIADEGGHVLAGGVVVLRDLLGLAFLRRRGFRA